MITSFDIPDDQPVQAHQPYRHNPDVVPVAPSTEPDNRRTGKIARLSKTIRDQICQLILDGLSYKEIIARLNLEPLAVTDDQLHRWKQGGYLDWLRRDEWLEQIRIQVGFASDVLQEESTPSIHQAMHMLK